MPYSPRTVITFRLKYQDSARMLRRVTLTNYTAGPLAVSGTHKILKYEQNDNVE